MNDTPQTEYDAEFETWLLRSNEELVASGAQDLDVDAMLARARNAAVANIAMAPHYPGTFSADPAVIDSNRTIELGYRTRDKLASALKKKYEKGWSIRDLAEWAGRSYGFVHRTLLEAGVQLRGRGASTRVKKK